MQAERAFRRGTALGCGRAGAALLAWHTPPKLGHSALCVTLGEQRDTAGSEAGIPPGVRGRFTERGGGNFEVAT